MKTNKTKADWEQDILQVTMKIHQEFPELSKYLEEMSETTLGIDSPNIDSANLEDYHDSLVDLLTNYAKTHSGKKLTKKAEKYLFPGYPHYSPSEDIYSQAKEMKDVNPEELSKNKPPNEKPGTKNEKGFKEAMAGSDLDVPGSELDDQQESVGSEDEENNYYSLGGDAHHDLEENKG